MWVERRAKEWNIPYTTTSHYVFGCVTGQQVLDLADEAPEADRGIRAGRLGRLQDLGRQRRQPHAYPDTRSP